MQQFIISDPAVMMGKPVIAGTCITVELILEKLAAGETIERISDARVGTVHPGEGFKRAILLCQRSCS